ncbi:BFH_HP2_G0051260.mRNA.1.CDS.1 [Saccharomyces cerevisiae]|nr:BFH_HP2_G0051260.mRNA.1.CDS.1 [Saccharomyces cerevisiae]CAI6789616.1 BFH_HP2_G0051260.mRNA.1.CDS.1 [Saccharomyces cerevisiae]CAI6806333.1 BFH_HP1_G0052180.mRNA.1.CDS.1 [Saccharomyces cerevisiae]
MKEELSKMSSMQNFEMIQRERLPTLYEVLIQRTSQPVDLWTFYTFLSQFPYAINYLDFWVDLMTHTRLCKNYIELVRKSLINFPQEQQQNGSTSTATFDLLNALIEEGHLDPEAPDKLLENSGPDVPFSPKLNELLGDWKHQSGIGQEALRNEDVALIVDEIMKRRSQQDGKPQITTKQLLHSAVGLCNTYLVSPEQSERYLSNIPMETRNRIIESVQIERKYDIEIFDDLKNLTYQFLEMDCFPKFLSRVALHNIHDEISDWRFHSVGVTNEKSNRSRGQTHISRSPFSNHTSISRIGFGLLWLGIGFWIGYVLIFLAYSRAIRVVTVVPFTLGCYCIVCGIYQVDIVYSWFGVTQRLLHRHKNAGNDEGDASSGTDHVPMILAVFGGRRRLTRIEHPFTRQLLRKRGLWCLLLVVGATAAFTVIFSCVPGRRV